MLRQPKRYVEVVLAGAVGFALNLAPIPLLARLWPGRIITLPIAIFFGPWYGLLAAMAGASAFALVAVLPVLLLSTVAGEAFSTKQTTDGGEHLQNAASAMRDHVENYLDTHGRAVAAIAATLESSTEPSARREQLLAQYAQAY